ncbi:MAG: lytic transglycosylase domain-containing protein [Hyphomicrobiaceae bacterium]
MLRATAASLALLLSITLTVGTGRADDPHPEMDKAIAPLFSGLPSSADLAHVKASTQAAYRNDIATARAEIEAIADKTARKLAEWYLLRNARGAAGPFDLERFRDGNPDWPTVEIRLRAEETLLESGGDTGKVIQLLEKEPPRSGAGYGALALAYLAAGDTAKAKATAQRGWREQDMDKDVEAVYLKRLGKLLTAADHKWRVDRMLLNDSRWEGTRKARVAAVKRLLPLLSSEERAKAEARIAVYLCYRGGKCGAGAAAALNKLPLEAFKDWGVAYHKIQILRRTDQEAGAWTRMLKVPTDATDLVSPDDWWIERRVNAYNALYAGQPKIAYQIAAEHGPVSVNPLKDAEFLAGWIALRFLGDPKRAKTHFEALVAAADGPISRSEGEYWLARAHEALGDKATAREHYGRAAKEYTTFYGQLSRQVLDPKSTKLSIAPVRVPPDETLDRFLRRDIVRATVIAKKAGLVDLMRVLLSHLRYRLDNEGEMLLLAHLAVSLGDTQSGVRIGKTGIERGFDLVQYAYPTQAMPEFSPLRKLPEQAIFYAIARQESEFNTLTVSGAGARGILQVMPVTAKHICQQYKIKCELSRLQTDPAYNAKLATAYIADRHDDFGGSYIMAIAGYNAGPGRVRGWVSKIGDPRKPNVDPVDWIELIHIEETREYVKKVLSNVQVYRARLGDASTANRIRQDLVRARGKSASAEN